MIYHYTTIASLAAILKNSSIRFSCADRLDDQEEAVSTDQGSYKKHIFVSSWSSKRIEDEEMWCKYSDCKRGIRIGIDSINIVFKPRDMYNPVGFIVSNIKPEQSDAIFITWGSQPLLVDYDKQKENPINEKATENTTKLIVKNIVAKKYKKWIYQSEMRFFLIGCRKSFLSRHNLKNESVQAIFTAFYKKRDFYSKYVDLILAPEAFQELEIVLGPCMGATDQQKIRDMVEEYIGKPLMESGGYLGNLTTSEIRCPVDIKRKP